MHKYLLLTVLSIILLSCVKNNPDPSWIEIKEWTLVENPNASVSAGELTHNFTDAWVYVNNSLLGVFEVPCKVPVLASGNATITVFPTIRNNGISATKKIYPFVSSHIENVVLTQNETTTINPVTQYNASTDFWIEDFENATFKLTHDNPSPATLIIESAPNGLNKYGRVLMNSSANLWAAYTSEALDFPSGSEIYLEVDYYNTNKLVTGLIAIQADGSNANNVNIAMNAQSADNIKWKKIYIDLRELVNASGGVSFLQSFRATLDEGDSEGLILIDNIKVVNY